MCNDICHFFTLAYFKACERHNIKGNLRMKPTQWVGLVARGADSCCFVFTQCACKRHNMKGNLSGKVKPAQWEGWVALGDAKFPAPNVSLYMKRYQKEILVEE